MTAIETMRNKINARNINQCMEDMRELGNQTYGREVALIHSEYVESIERRWPALAEAAWEILLTESDAGKNLEFVEALEALRKETGFVCKQCEGVSPVGVGYASTRAEDASLFDSCMISACGCGYSQRA